VPSQTQTLRLADSDTQTLRISETSDTQSLKLPDSVLPVRPSDSRTHALRFSGSPTPRLTFQTLRLSGSDLHFRLKPPEAFRCIRLTFQTLRLSDSQRLSDSGSQTFRHVRSSDSQALRCKPQTRKDTRECRSCIAQTIPFSTTLSSILLPALLPLPHSFRRLRHNRPVGWHDATVLGLSCVSVSSFVALMLASCVVLDPSDILAPDGPVLHVANPSTRKLSGKSRRRLRGCASFLVLTVEMQR